MKYKKSIIFICLCLAVLLTFLTRRQYNVFRNVIGEVYGVEHEFISIGEDTYTVCFDSGYHASDKNKVLGCVLFEDTETDPMTVYSIKGVEDNEYIYTLWVYDGYIYKKDVK